MPALKKSIELQYCANAGIKNIGLSATQTNAVIEKMQLLQLLALNISIGLLHRGTACIKNIGFTSP